MNIRTYEDTIDGYGQPEDLIRNLYNAIELFELRAKDHRRRQEEIFKENKC